MGEGDTTTAEVEGRAFCEVHGWNHGSDCPDCVAEEAPVLAAATSPGPVDAEGLPIHHAQDVVQVDDHTVAMKPRRPRGFAAMDRAKVSEIAANGGVAAHKAGTAHEFTSDEAREAGRKGGRATHAKRRAAKL